MPYHLSPNGSRLCKATKGSCPYARAGEPHFSNLADANRAFEEKMANTFGGVEPFKKSLEQRATEAILYTPRDAFVKAIAGVVASAPIRNMVKAIQAVRNAPENARVVIAEKSRMVWANLVEVKETDPQIAAEAARRMAYDMWLRQAEQEKLRAYHAAMVRYRQDLATWRSQMDTHYGKERNLSPNQLRAGDMVETSDGRMKVHRVSLKNGVASVQIRDSRSGQFRKSLQIPQNAIVHLRRPSRDEIKGSITGRVSAGYRRAIAKTGSYVGETKRVWGVATDRVKLATNQQRTAFNTLLSIDRSAQMSRRASRNAFSPMPRFHGSKAIATA